MGATTNVPDITPHDTSFPFKRAWQDVNKSDQHHYTTDQDYFNFLK